MDCPWLTAEESTFSNLPASVATEARKRSFNTVRKLQRRARELAVLDCQKRFGTASNLDIESDVKKHKRNKSAYVSRQTNRNYELLLIEYVRLSEIERDYAVRSFAKAVSEMQYLRALVDALAAQLASKMDGHVYQHEHTFPTRLLGHSSLPSPTLTNTTLDNLSDKQVSDLYDKDSLCFKKDSTPLF